MKKNMNKALATLKNKKGFTMIELIIVIAIIAILAAIAIPTFTGFLSTASKTAAEAEARNVYLAAKAYAVTAEVSGETLTGTYSSTDAVVAEIASESGVDASDITSVSFNNGTYAVVLVYNDGTYTVTVSDGDISSTEN